MKNQTTRINEKRICGRAAAVMSAGAMLMTSAFAAGADFSKVYVPVVQLLNSLLVPLLAIVGAVGTLYCVLLGVKYAKAEEPQDREKAKSHLKNAIIGFVLIFVLLVVLKLLMPVLKGWAANYKAI